EEEAELLRSLLDLPSVDPKPNLWQLTTNDLEESLREGEADIGVEISGSGGGQPDLNPRQQYHVRLIRRKESMTGLQAEEFITDRVPVAKVRILKARLRAAARVSDPASPVKAEVTTIDSGPEAKTSYLTALVPLVLVLMTITGAVYPAIDLTAGERER